ncbi:hypothetical protein VN12_09650 [Pirellula sp. SH-Sr6A]|nr:hypothetical protein VN12_09650 [Pirellula sp. SH-Sr6A]
MVDSDAEYTQCFCYLSVKPLHRVYGCESGVVHVSESSGVQCLLPRFSIKRSSIRSHSELHPTYIPGRLQAEIGSSRNKSGTVVSLFVTTKKGSLTSSERSMDYPRPVDRGLECIRWLAHPCSEPTGSSMDRSLRNIGKMMSEWYE